MSKKSMKFKTAGKSGDILNYLEKLVDSIKKGTVHMQKEGDTITLKPQGTIYFELSAAQKDDKEKIEFELSWLVGAVEAEEDVDFKISAEAPEPKEEKPVEEKPAEEKPVEEKPAEKKPVEKKPVEKKEAPKEEKKADIKIEAKEDAPKPNTGAAKHKAKTAAPAAKAQPKK